MEQIRLPVNQTQRESLVAERESLVTEWESLVTERESLFIKPWFSYYTAA